MKISVVIPIYNQAIVFLETYNCINNQTYQNYEIIIGNDRSTDEIGNIVEKINDEKIRFYDFEENKGYCENLARTIEKANGEIILLLGADDIFSKNYFERVVTAFEDPSVMGVTRAYYWFTKSVSVPVRVKSHVSKNQMNDIKINLKSDKQEIQKLLSSCDQLSLLAFRLEQGLHNLIVNDMFTAHVYLMVNALKKGNIIFLSGMPLAVRIGVSQTRLISKIYNSSPIMQWVKLVNILCDHDQKLKSYLLESWILKNYIGLLQIRNYGSVNAFLNEVYILVKYRKKNLLSVTFVIIVILCAIIPRAFLSRFVDYIKEKIISPNLRGIQLD